MKQISYFFLAILLLFCAYIVFRLIVRRDYHTRGRLSALSSSLQLIVFIGFFAFPYQYYPPEWALFWLAGTTSAPGLHYVGLLFICVGFLSAFGTMAWFGIRRAFGLHIDGLKKAGPYKISRNPQILGGYLLVSGPSLQRPSLYAVGWILMYAVITHWMILTEEEHLLRLYGEVYKQYCVEVPRYLHVRSNNSKINRTTR
jgi:protein-S-isoprenylcysteine O-methyltransferase Ste14